MKSILKYNQIKFKMSYFSVRNQYWIGTDVEFGRSFINIFCKDLSKLQLEKFKLDV